MKIDLALLQNIIQFMQNHQRHYVKGSEFCEAFHLMNNQEAQHFVAHLRLLRETQMIYGDIPTWVFDPLQEKWTIPGSYRLALIGHGLEEAITAYNRAGLTAHLKSPASFVNAFLTHFDATSKRNQDQVHERESQQERQSSYEKEREF